MGQIVEELKKVLELQLKHENPSSDQSKAEDEGTSFNSFKVEFLEIPLSEIIQATNHFSTTCLVESGRFGNVYKAELDVLDFKSLSSMKGRCEEKLPKMRKTVAVKRLRFGADDQQGIQGLLTEVKLIISCKHPNLVSLLGFSRGNGEMILVYEFLSRGSLEDYLQNCSAEFNLTWAQRIQICLDIAHGINHLHTYTEGKPSIVHGDIKSDNILLDDNLNAKLDHLGLSKVDRKEEASRSTLCTNSIVGITSYMDPEYLRTGIYKKESDIYSFGVVLFEVLCGRVAYDWVFTKENNRGLVPIAMRLFKEGTLQDMLDPRMIKEYDEHIFSLNIAPNRDSFNTFSKIAYECVAESKAKRPKMEVVIKELQDALKLQGDIVILSRFQLPDIMLATQKFAETYFVGLDTNGHVYRAELDQTSNNNMSITKKNDKSEPSSKRMTVAIKRITGRKQGFFEELEMRAYKHPNIMPLLGFCYQDDEMMLVYEYAADRSLTDYLRNVDNFTWSQRLHICLKIARGLAHLHTKMVDQSIIRIDVRSANIFVDKNREAKIGWFVISNSHPTNQEIEMKVYEDPEYETANKLERKSEIYSFGVVLFEIFCGKVAYDPVYISEKGLAHVARRCYVDGTILRKMDPRLNGESGHEDNSTSNRAPDQNSLDTFLKIAFGCLGKAVKRPTMEMVIKELEWALMVHDPKHARGV
ncbi:hypothetical protein QVD17_37435 [Tagetes erecta]|uniref:Protein kinase domain-containing protein n=1 Tax=Tagetes erecta TaxID=13708 RepID=A0AAD8JW07_TARER|nr:hypothetical protein QVD17_37435 [Tagetes erecta]